MSAQNNRFINSIKNESLLYYHFLDGYIDKDTGSNIDNTIIHKYIGSYENINKYGNIHIAKLIYNMNDDVILSCYNITTNETIMLFNDVDNYELLIDIFKYCIIQTLHDNHATSILIYHINNEMYLYLFNSGSGIENHKKNIDMYVPYKGIKICSDITNEELFLHAIKIIKCIFLINKYYYYYTNSNGEQTYDNIILVLSKISTYLKDILDETYDIHILTDFYRKEYNIKNILEFTFVKHDSERNSLKEKKGDYEDIFYHNFHDLKSTKIYYDLIYTIINNISKKSQPIDINFIVTNDETIEIVTKNILDKLIFHKFDDNDIYIYSQQSGSCSWFSLYWTFIFYYVINDDNDEYVNIIKYIISEFYNILDKDIFTIEQFNEITIDYRIYMYKLYNKFVALKIFDDNLLINQIDNYYKNIIINIDKTPISYYKDTYNNEYYFDIEKYEEKIFMMTYYEDSQKYNEILDIIKRVSATDIINIFLLLSKKYYKSDILNPIGYIDTNEIITKIIDTTDIILLYDDNKEKIINGLEYIIKIFIDQYLLLDNTINETFYHYLIPYINYIDDYYHNTMFESFESFKLSESSKLLNKYVFFIKRLILIKQLFNRVLYICDLFRTNKITNIYDSHQRQIYDTLSSNINTLSCNILNIILQTIISTKISLYNIKYENTQYDIILTNKYFNFLNDSIPVLIPIYNIIDKYSNLNRTSNDYIIKKNFLYEYPEYILSYIDNDDKYSTIDNFIKLHILDLFKPGNRIYRINILKHHVDYWYKYKDQDDILENYRYICILNNIYKLLFKTKQTKDYEKFHINLLNITNYYNFTNFNKLLDYLIYCSDNDIDITETLIFISNIKKLLRQPVNEQLSTKDVIIINDISYIKKQIDTDIFTFFNFDDTNYYINEIIFNDTDNVDNSEQIIYTDQIIYKFYDDKYIKFKCNITNLQSSDNYTIKIEILEIYINDNKVIKYNDIIYPFKYFIPTSCFHLIYLENNVYYISFLIDNRINFDKKSSINFNILLLKKSYIKSGIYTYKINPNNNLLFDKMSSDEYNILLHIFSDFHLNEYNILYFINRNIIYDGNGYCTNQNFYNLFKDHIIKLNETIQQNNIVTGVNILDETKNIYIKTTICDDKLDKNLCYESIIKLNNKIKKYNISNIPKLIKKIQKILKYLEQNIIDITLFMKNYSINYILNNLNDLLYNYSLNIKINIFLNKSLNLLNNRELESFISLLKISVDSFNVREINFNYKFEVLFELISGMELSKDQMDRYTSIINKYVEYSSTSYYDIIPIRKNIMKPIFSAKGGSLSSSSSSNFIYPLHHFMMGKGKSKVITPILLLYFIFIHNKTVIIVVPVHLEKQTTNTIDYYISIFNIKKSKILILSDVDIKELFLNGTFNNDNSNYIMLIDEFDSILDPLQSNYNITINKTLKFKELIDFVKYIVSNHINIDRDNNILNILDDIKIDDKTENYNIKELILNDINNIITGINDKQTLENVNWGIHPIKCYAIPYRTKDKPLMTSNFSSYTTTIFLTIFYYLKLNPIITDQLIEYMINYDLNTKWFSCQKEYFNRQFLLDNKYIDIDIINRVLDYILDKILLAETQQNTSFVDIINIDNIFKIGYSGTLNIDLPNLYSDNFSSTEIVEDYDEEINIKYAIEKSKIILFNGNELTIINNLLDICNNYNALIDVIGLFKDTSNENIAMQIYDIINIQLIKTELRDVIFIDNNDDIFVIRNSLIKKYSENYKYTNPFIYYSLTHIIGIDIDQNNYPIMKGLCIIDDNVRYTTVAQAICRLRKLNYGHSVDFASINTKYKQLDPIILKKIFIDNDEDNKNNKKDYLTYQTIKSIIRKDLTKNYKLNFNKIYTEKIIHYYDTTKNDNLFKLLQISNPILNDELLTDIFNDIFNINISNYINLLKTINTKEQILKLVYCINTKSQLQYECNENVENEDDDSVDAEYNEENEQTIVIEQLEDSIKNLKNDYTPFVYNFNKYAINDEILFSLGIVLDDFISFLPNIFTNTNEYFSYTNIFNYAFIHRPHINNLLIIPFYMVPFYIDRYKIYNNQLNLINVNNSFKNYSLHDNEFIKTMKEHVLIKMLNFDFESLSIKTTTNTNKLIISISCFYYINNILLLSTLNYTK
jgi:hypothetical protein